MNDQWLRSFLLSAECRSFSKAARASFISTTALVQQINLFERELGFSLFVRSHSGVELTPAGESFYTDAKQVLDLYEHGVSRAVEVARQGRIVIRMAFEPYQFPENWISLLGNIHTAQSNIGVRMKNIPITEQVNAIRKGEADCCILGKQKKEFLGTLGFLELFEDTYSFCMNPGHPLAGKSLLTLEDLRGQTVLCGNYTTLEKSFAVSLEGIATVRQLSGDYNLGVRMEFGSDTEMYIIHGAWRDTHSLLQRVVDSDIPAGKVGLIYNKALEEPVRKLRDYFLENL